MYSHAQPGLRGDHLSAAQTEAIRFGATLEFQRSGKRIKGIVAVINEDGKVARGVVIISLSPRDRRATENIKRDVRQMVRSLRNGP